MSRKQHKRRAGSMVLDAIAGIFILAIVFGVGLSVASADSSDTLVQAGAFGFDENTQKVTAATQVPAANSSASSHKASTETLLSKRSSRTIEASLLMAEQIERDVYAREQVELKAQKEREAAEDRAIFKRVKIQKEMQGVMMELPRDEGKTTQRGHHAKRDGNASASSAVEPKLLLETEEYGLPAVNWAVGRKVFVDKWTKRIDKYLDGSPLEGYGYAFAEAAWDRGVDPRWSPAISNTESSKGAICFLPCNAWGWGDSEWDDWDSAIRDHVAGLASVYGYCITPEAAAIYCPPNSVVWYANTFSEMARI